MYLDSGERHAKRYERSWFALSEIVGVRRVIPSPAFTLASRSVRSTVIDISTGESGSDASVVIATCAAKIVLLKPTERAVKYNRAIFALVIPRVLQTLNPLAQERSSVIKQAILRSKQAILKSKQAV